MGDMGSPAPRNLQASFNELATESGLARNYGKHQSGMLHKPNASTPEMVPEMRRRLACLVIRHQNTLERTDERTDERSVTPAVAWMPHGSTRCCQRSAGARVCVTPQNKCMAVSAESATHEPPEGRIVMGASIRAGESDIKRQRWALSAAAA